VGTRRRERAEEGEDGGPLDTGTEPYLQPFLRYSAPSPQNMLINPPTNTANCNTSWQR